MKDQDFTRIRNAVAGYWPAYTFTDQARKAWRHLLGPFPIEATLDALSSYAAEGHPFPPIAGQLAARISPPAESTPRETEPDRCRRQMKQAQKLCSRRDFDFFWDDYWSSHLPESEYPFSELPTRKAA